MIAGRFGDFCCDLRRSRCPVNFDAGANVGEEDAKDEGDLEKAEDVCKTMESQLAELKYCQAGLEMTKALALEQLTRIDAAAAGQVHDAPAAGGEVDDTAGGGEVDDVPAGGEVDDVAGADAAHRVLNGVHAGDGGESNVDVIQNDDIPLSDEQVLYKKLLSFSPDEWDDHLDKALAVSANQDAPVVPLLEIPSTGGNFFPYLPTYAKTLVSGKVPWLPIEPFRFRELPIADVHFWVYLCRKCVVPLPPPHPDVNWPAYCFVWIGPDGRVIRKGKSETSLIAARKSLWRMMDVKKDQSKWKKDIGVLGKGWDQFPIVIIDPPSLTQRQGSLAKSRCRWEAISDNMYCMWC